MLGGTSPEGFNYELFLDEHGQKISKSKGNGLTMDDWLRYGAPESLAYYMFQSPKSAKKLYFDVIPRATDEFFQQLDAFPRVAALYLRPAQRIDDIGVERRLPIRGCRIFARLGIAGNEELHVAAADHFA